MGAIGGLLGTAGGANGTGFAAPSTGNIVTPGQLTAANNYTTNALGQQQAFTNAVGANGTAGLAAQGQALSELQQGAAGQGPNPALAQLNQTTGQNVANQSALMAGQRGASQNAGLIARQAAQQGAATQQQAAGQAATQQAQQQIAYQQALAGQANIQVAQQGSATQAQTQAAENQQQYLSGTAAGLQTSVNQGNAALAGNAMTGQQNLIGNITGGVGSALGLAQGGVIPHFNSGTGPGGVPQAGQYDQNFQGMSDQTWNTLGANPNQPNPNPIQTPPSPIQANSTSQSPIQAATTQPSSSPAAQSGPKSTAGKFLSGFNQSNQAKSQSQPQKLQGMSLAGNTIGQGIGAGLKSLFGSSPSTPSGIGERDSSEDAAQYLGANTELGSGGDTEEQATDNDTSGTQNAAKGGRIKKMAKGGKVPAMVSPGEQYIPPKEVKKVLKGEKAPLSAGERIPGVPKYMGNDYRNDTVKKTLTEGGLVIPNSVMQSKNPHWEAMKFVHAHVAKNGKGLPKK